ncbi:Gfo/Idh/MocA family oxidoreductase [Candidatus Sumerlaeota bacterium]|nr:Gfo/Idh/MocA family oxidoreductase [Candidatus Sumerlaeota bacterium]
MANDALNRTKQSAIIVGAGLMGRWHASTLRRIGVTVAAIVDRDETCAKSLANSFGISIASSDWLKILEAQTQATVHICTPTPSHAELARQALERGHHVVVEKPLAASLSETESLLALAAERKLGICPVHQFPFQSGLLWLRDHRDCLGTIHHVQMTICSAGAVGRDDRGSDIIAIEIAPHVASVLPLISDAGPDLGIWRIARVSAGEWRIEAATGGTSLAATISMHGRPTRNELRVIGSSATAVANLFHGYVFLESGSPTRANKALLPFQTAGSQFLAAGINLFRRAVDREPAYPGLRELFRRFYNSLDGFAPPPITASEIRGAARLMELCRAECERPGVPPEN